MSESKYKQSRTGWAKKAEFYPSNTANTVFCESIKECAVAGFCHSVIKTE